MKTKTLKLILLVSVVFNFTIIAAAGYFYFQGSRCRIADRPDRSAAIAEKLGLSPEQQASMKEADAAFRTEAGVKRAGLSKKREHLLSLIKAETADKAAIGAALADINALQGEIEAAVVEHMLAEKSMLTPEQREKYLKLLEKRFERGRERMERRFGKGL
ncbi:MAG: hypothetical protein A2052_09480 [Deltaproteobacteria bacterium GWA2_54_12]|nr:MAG: hypothetical protein A2052_09480 [Deltaproteobacteria bacterium GWA2_54_12]